VNCGITRRKFLGGAIALSAGSIALSTRERLSHRIPTQGGSSAVTIVRQAAYTQDLYATVRRVLAEQRLDVRGKCVVLKPNLVEFEPGGAINTDPMMVHAALEAFRSMGAADVRIAEGPGHRRGTFDLAEAAGYFGVIPDFEKIFTDLNLDDVSHVKLRDPFSTLKSLYLPHTALSCDLLVSMPKMKTHHWAGATLSMKNLFGLVPGGVYGWPKNVLHWAGIAECIADLHTLFPRTFALVDGIVGMEGNGPIQGVPKQAGVIVAGSDMVAVDATCCRIMGIDPLKIEYLKLARTNAGLSESAIHQTGEPIGLVKNPFALLPQFASLRA
jgi:uncharacterized protein (DUF362 family)